MRPGVRALLALPGIALVSWAVLGMLRLFGASGGVWVIYTCVIVSAAGFSLAGALERPLPPLSAARRAEVARLSLAVVVPVYNEDERALRACLASMVAQTRLPQAIVVVDDGSTGSDYAEARALLAEDGAATGVSTTWLTRPHRGKRAAQLAALPLLGDADVLLLVDSDTELSPRANELAMAGFADRRVQSVAPLVVGANYATNVLTRMMELIFVVTQLTERSAMSLLGSVMVNNGAAAYYRAPVLRDHARAYARETFAGRPVTFSDDSLLTLLALRRGRAVHQPLALAYTLMPERVGHHRRQQLRWMRGSTIRSVWRFRYLPLSRPAYWAHLLKWAQYVTTALLMGILLLVGAGRHPELLAWGLAVNVGIHMLVGARYLTARRDQSAAQRVGVYSTAPLAALWSIFVLRPLRWWAMATILSTEWGTRGQVEVRRS